MMHFCMQKILLLCSLASLCGCQVNAIATDDDTPVFGSSVFELFVLQQDYDRTFNILFVPDESYGDLSVLTNRQSFVNDLAEIIESSYWQNQGYYFNFPHFNYFYMVEAGSVTERADDANGNFQCPSVVWPSEVDTDGAFADVKLLIHQNSLRDCANPASGRATAEPASFRTVAHETAHALFGLGDEYCCDSSYSHAPPVLYNSQTSCNSDSANTAWRNCISLTSSRDGSVWWRSEGNVANNALMIGTGNTVWEFGPGDWVIMDAAYQTLPGTSGPSSTGDPAVFAPDNWNRPPPPSP